MLGQQDIQGFLENLGILPGNEGAGDIFFIREAKIAEMKVSEPSKNAFLFSSKNIL